MNTHYKVSANPVTRAEGRLHWLAALTESLIHPTAVSALAEVSLERSARLQEVFERLALPATHRRLLDDITRLAMTMGADPAAVRLMAALGNRGIFKGHGLTLTQYWLGEVWYDVRSSRASHKDIQSMRDQMLRLESDLLALIRSGRLMVDEARKLRPASNLLMYGWAVLKPALSDTVSSGERICSALEELAQQDQPEIAQAIFRRSVIRQNFYNTVVPVGRSTAQKMFVFSLGASALIGLAVGVSNVFALLIMGWVLYGAAQAAMRMFQAWQQQGVRHKVRVQYQQVLQPTLAALKNLLETLPARPEEVMAWLNKHQAALDTGARFSAAEGAAVQTYTERDALAYPEVLEQKFKLGEKERSLGGAFSALVKTLRPFYLTKDFDFTDYLKEKPASTIAMADMAEDSSIRDALFNPLRGLPEDWQARLSKMLPRAIDKLIAQDRSQDAFVLWQQLRTLDPYASVSAAAFKAIQERVEARLNKLRDEQVLWQGQVLIQLRAGSGKPEDVCKAALAEVQKHLQALERDRTMLLAIGATRPKMYALESARAHKQRQQALAQAAQMAEAQFHFMADLAVAADALALELQAELIKQSKTAFEKVREADGVAKLAVTESFKVPNGKLKGWFQLPWDFSVLRNHKWLRVQMGRRFFKGILHRNLIQPLGSQDFNWFDFPRRAFWKNILWHSDFKFDVLTSGPFHVLSNLYFYGRLTAPRAGDPLETKAERQARLLGDRQMQQATGFGAVLQGLAEYGFLGAGFNVVYSVLSWAVINVCAETLVLGGIGTAWRWFELLAIRGLAAGYVMPGYAQHLCALWSPQTLNAKGQAQARDFGKLLAQEHFVAPFREFAEAYQMARQNGTLRSFLSYGGHQPLWYVRRQVHDQEYSIQLAMQELAYRVIEEWSQPRINAAHARIAQLYAKHAKRIIENTDALPEDKREKLLKSLGAEALREECLVAVEIIRNA